MRAIPLDLYEEIEGLDPKIKSVFLKFFEYLIKERVTKDDFQRLTEKVEKLADIVAELAEAQKKTEEELKTLSKTVAELAEAQKRTDQRVAELAEAQKRTEQKVAELAEAQRRTEEEVRTLAQELKRTRQDLGGLSLSFSYAFENEAYRMLPQVLKRYGLELEDKLIRKEIAGEEINFFATAKRNGKTVYIVGETKLRLDDTKKRDDVFKQLEKKISAVKKVYGEVEIVPLIVTHFAKESMLKKAKERGIIVVQSYEC
jgi:predicted transcriptional regulator